MDSNTRKQSEPPPATPPGDLYFEQKQESRRAEPCRLKRPNPARVGAWRLVRRAAFSTGVMLFLLVSAILLLRLTAAKPKAPQAAATNLAATAVETAGEPTEPQPDDGEKPDPELMQRAVLMSREAAALSQTGAWSGAAENYRRTLDICPDFSAAQAGLGHALLMQGDLDGAKIFLRKAAASDPGNIVVLNGLGSLEMLRKNPGKAARFFDAAAALEPEDLESRLNLARCDFALGYVDRAKEHVQQALEKHPDDPETLRYLAYLEAAAGDYDKAMDILNRAIQRAPDMSALYKDAAATCALMGNAAKAVDYLRKAAGLDSAENIRLVFGEPVFLAARQTPEGRNLENELAAKAQMEKEAGNAAPKDADSAAETTTADIQNK